MQGMLAVWLVSTPKVILKRLRVNLVVDILFFLSYPILMRPECVVLIPCTIFFWDQLSTFKKSILVSHNVISEGDFAVIQDRVDSIVAPSNIGRIPHKISGGYC